MLRKMLHNKEEARVKNRKKDITFELKETCNFSEVFQHCSRAYDSLSSSEKPDAEIGHVRAYYDGYGWQGQYFPCRNHLRTEAFIQESQDIYCCLVTQLGTLETMKAFCKKYPLAKAGENEYNFFMNGRAADYWIRFITRSDDYNLYLKAYAKGL